MLGAWLVATVALAGGGLGWDDLPAATDAAWESGAGARFRAEAGGAEAARRAEPLTQAWASIQVGPNPIPGMPVIDDNTQALVGISLGDRRGRRRAWWAATATAIAAEGDAERLAFAEAVRDAWLEVWAPAAFAEHLGEHAASLELRLAALDPAAAAGVVAPMVVEDLRVEAARLRAEAAAEARSADAAAVTLAALLGRQVVVDAASLPELEAGIVAAPNPWREVLDRLEALPELRALDAGAAALRAQARAARADSPVSLSAGAVLRLTPDGTLSAGPLVAVQVPLANPSAPDARAAEGRAEAVAAERAWRLTQLRAEVEAEATALDAATARHAAVTATVEAPLRARLERLEAAHDRGLVPVEAVLVARRDVHEAFHDRALAAADLLARRARGTALLASLDASEPR